MPEIIRFPQNDLSPEAIDVKARDVRGACLLVLANNPERTAAGKSLVAYCCVLPLQPQRRPQLRPAALSANRVKLVR
jgi:hypothetical protein